MTRAEYVEDIKVELGSPIVEVENVELIGQYVDQAFREVCPYITETRFVTVNNSQGGIDTSDYKISTVVQLLRTQNPSGIQDITDVYALGAVSYPTQGVPSSSLLMSNYLYRTQINQIKSTVETDLDFTYDSFNHKLYVNTFYPRPSQVTIVYIPEFEDVSEVKDQYWVNYILRLAKALSKISLGRIRGKYELSSSLYKLDGSTLISEGIAERDAIREELIENADLAFPTD